MNCSPKILIIEDSSQSGFGGGQRVTLEVIQASCGFANICVFDLCPSALLREARSYNVKTKVIGVLSRIWPFVFVIRFLELLVFGSIRIFWERPQFIYITTRLGIFSCLVFKLTFPKVKIIYHYHMLTGQRFFWRLYDRLVAEISYKMVFSSEFIRRDTFEANKNFANFGHKTITMPLLPAKWSIEEQILLEPKTPGTFVIGYVGKLSEPKGILLLLNALPLLPSWLDWTCSVCGDGPLADGLESHIAKNIRNRINVLGLVDTTLALYRSFSVLVVPSFNVEESLGLTALEGIQAGLPVYVAPRGNLKSFVSENLCSILPGPEPSKIASGLVSAYHALEQNRVRPIEVRDTGTDRFAIFCKALFDAI